MSRRVSGMSKAWVMGGAQRQVIGPTPEESKLASDIDSLPPDAKAHVIQRFGASDHKTGAQVVRGLKLRPSPKQDRKAIAQIVLQTGARGGQFYVTSSGEKVYVGKGQG